MREGFAAMNCSKMFLVVLRLCSIKSRAEATGRKLGNLYRQNEMPETQKSLFPIYSRLPKLDVAGSPNVSRYFALEAAARTAAQRFFVASIILCRPARA
jgi:hypothetical protein